MVWPGTWRRLTWGDRLSFLTVAIIVVSAVRTAPTRGQGPEEHASSLAWQTLAPMPVGVFAAAASRAGDRAVITGGINQGGFSETAVQRMDLGRSAWLTVTRLRMARCFHAQVTLADQRVLVLGGQSGRVPGALRPIASCELVDPATGRVWPVPDLPRPLFEPTAHALGDGRVLVIGGQGAWVLDPALRGWEQVADLHHQRRAHASVELDDGTILVVGGQAGGGPELLDIAAGTSRLVAVDGVEGLDDLEVVALPGRRAWVLGGQKPGGDTVDQTWVLDLADPGGPKCEPGPPLLVRGGLADHRIVQVGPWVIVAGGETQRAGVDVELSVARLLDTGTLAVWSLPDLPGAHDDAVAVATGRGMILFGGFTTRPGRRGGDLPWPRAVGQVHRLEVPADRVRGGAAGVPPRPIPAH